MQIDSEFCLTYGVRASALADWRASVADAFKAIQLSNTCDVYGDEGRSAATAALESAGDRAAAAGEGNQFTQLLNDEARARSSIQVYTALLNRYSKDGQIDQALQATDSAIALIPAGDTNARKQYDDFRKGLVDLQGLIQAAQANPNDPQAHRKLAEMWQARQQPQYALPEYQKVVQLSPEDYEARRRVVLLSLQIGQIVQATQALTPTLGVAPLNDRPFWDRLSKVLEDASSGSREVALGELDALIQTVDSKDTLAMDSLKALRSRLQE